MTNTSEAIVEVTAALKPCPFCGAPAERLTIGEDEPNNAGGDVIVCTRCQASSHVEFGYKENLVDHWNTRAAEQSRASTPAVGREAIAGLIERMRAAVTYQYMPMSARKLLAEAADALTAERRGSAHSMDTEAIESAVHRTVVSWSNGQQPKPLKAMIADAILALHPPASDDAIAARDAEVTLREAAEDLLAARERLGPAVFERHDLWNCLAELLKGDRT